MAASSSKQPPATTPQGRENQLANLALDLAERQLREGTASSQVITHFLKTVTMRDELEKKKIEAEILEKQTKINQTNSQGTSEDLHKRVLRALSDYQGREDDDADDY